MSDKTETPRCIVTGNPCGTDTVMVGMECPSTGGKCVNKRVMSDKTETPMKKPTLAELEALLARTDVTVSILPDGSLVVNDRIAELERELAEKAREVEEAVKANAALVAVHEQQLAAFYSRAEKAEAECAALREDKARLDAAGKSYWKIDPFEMPTGAGDADVGWRVTGYFMALPKERVIAEVYEDNIRAAIDSARKA